MTRMTITTDGARAFDADALLAALPVRPITPPPAGTSRPRLKWTVSGGPYNGFAPVERFRTGALAAWLQGLGCMAPPETCSVCEAPAAHTHGENYFDLESWIDLCRACHSVLHNRFHLVEAWPGRLDRFGVAVDLWARLISPAPFDLAALIRARGGCEPSPDAVLDGQSPARAPRARRQRFGEIGIPPGGRLVHPRAPDLEIEVVDDVSLLWRGETHSLTSLTRKLTAEFGLPTSRELWTFEGVSLGAIYEATYRPT